MCRYCHNNCLTAAACDCAGHESQVCTSHKLQLPAAHCPARAAGGRRRSPLHGRGSLPRPAWRPSRWRSLSAAIHERAAGRSCRRRSLWGHRVPPACRTGAIRCCFSPSVDAPCDQGYPAAPLTMEVWGAWLEKVTGNMVVVCLQPTPSRPEENLDCIRSCQTLSSRADMYA